MFGEKQHLSGFEELVVRVRSSRGSSRIAIGKELGGYAVVELHKIIKHLELAANQDLPATTPRSFARWFALRGPEACGKILLAMEFVPRQQIVNSTNPVPPAQQLGSPMLRESDFLDVEEDASTTVGSPLRSARFGPRISTTSPHYYLELVLHGLRFLPAEAGRVAIVINVRDEYNPRQGVTVRTEWIDHSGVVAGWSFPPQRLVLGADPTSSLEGSEQITLRIVDPSDGTIAKREFRVRDLLADYAEDHPGEANGALVSLVAWLVMPYKSAQHANKRAPEVKASLKIALAEHTIPLGDLTLL